MYLKAPCRGLCIVKGGNRAPLRNLKVLKLPFLCIHCFIWGGEEGKLFLRDARFS